MDQSLIFLILVLEIAYSIYASFKLKSLWTLIPTRSKFIVGARDQYLTEVEESKGSVDAEEPLASHTLIEPGLTNEERLAQREDVIATEHGEQEVSQIVLLVQPSNTFRHIIYDLNEYALKNRGSASDFAIVKDVVDRPVDALIDHAESRTSTPLYLGLAGALLGIIVGLEKMSRSVSVDRGVDELTSPVGAGAAMTVLTDNLSELLGSVSFAMWASLLGVLLTIFLTMATRKTTSTVDQRRNGFFTFYQIEFLPRISRDVNSVLSSLNGTLDKFNKQFGGNVEAMQKSFTQNKSAIQEQQKVLEAMRQLSVGGALEGTIKLYESVNLASKSLDKLTPHIERVHYMIAEVGRSGERFAKVASNVENVEAIVTNLKLAVLSTNEVQQWASRHLSQLDDTSKSANQVSHSIVASFEESQRKILEHLDPLVETFRIMIQTLESTTSSVIVEAQDSINLIPTQIEPMMREAFTSQTIHKVTSSSDSAAAAARKAEVEVQKTREVRQEVSALLDKHYVTMNRLTKELASLQRHHETNSSAIETLLRRRPWWWMTSQKARSTPPQLPS